MVTIVASVAEDHVFLMLGILTQLTRSVVGGGSTGYHYGFGGVPGSEGVGHQGARIRAAPIGRVFSVNSSRGKAVFTFRVDEVFESLYGFTSGLVQR